MAKYKLMQRINPSDRTAPKKWYATPTSEKPQTAQATVRAATENTTTAPLEMDGSCYLLRKYAEKQLLQGHIATIPYFGTLRITFKSDGVDSVSAFNAGTMIKEPRLIFTPSKEFREAVINNLTFEGAGVIADGITYGSVANYIQATGKASADDGTSDSGSTDSGSSSDSGDSNPL